MAIALIAEVVDHAPAALTWRELYVLVVLAEAADKDTRKIWRNYEGDDERDAIFRARLRCSRSQYYAILKALIGHGVIEVVQRGQRHRRAEYRIAHLRPPASLSVPETGTLRIGALTDASGSREQGPREAVSIPETGTLTTPQGPGLESQGPGFTPSGSRNSALRVPESGTPSPQSPTSPSSSPLALVRAARVVAEGEEEEFIQWMIKTRKPQSTAWWQKVIGNGDLPTHAETWRASRQSAAPAAITGPSVATRSPAARPVAETLSHRPSEDSIVQAADAPAFQQMREQLRRRTTTPVTQPTIDAYQDGDDPDELANF